MTKKVILDSDLPLHTYILPFDYFLSEFFPPSKGVRSLEVCCLLAPRPASIVSRRPSSYMSFICEEGTVKPMKPPLRLTGEGSIGLGLKIGAPPAPPPLRLRFRLLPLGIRCLWEGTVKPRNCENVVADQINAYVIYEWSLRQKIPSK